MLRGSAAGKTRRVDLAPGGARARGRAPPRRVLGMRSARLARRRAVSGEQAGRSRLRWQRLARRCRRAPGPRAVRPGGRFSATGRRQRLGGFRRTGRAPSRSGLPLGHLPPRLGWRRLRGKPRPPTRIRGKNPIGERRPPGSDGGNSSRVGKTRLCVLGGSGARRRVRLHSLSLLATGVWSQVCAPAPRSRSRCAREPVAHPGRPPRAARRPRAAGR